MFACLVGHSQNKLPTIRGLTVFPYNPFVVFMKPWVQVTAKCCDWIEWVWTLKMSQYKKYKNWKCLISNSFISFKKVQRETELQRGGIAYLQQCKQKTWKGNIKHKRKFQFTYSSDIDCTLNNHISHFKNSIYLQVLKWMLPIPSYKICVQLI